MGAIRLGRVHTTEERRPPDAIRAARPDREGIQLLVQLTSAPAANGSPFCRDSPSKGVAAEEVKIDGLAVGKVEGDGCAAVEDKILGDFAQPRPKSALRHRQDVKTRRVHYQNPRPPELGKTKSCYSPSSLRSSCLGVRGF